MKNLGKITTALALFLLLTACGNGGGSSSDPKPLTDCKLDASNIGNCKI